MSKTNNVLFNEAELLIIQKAFGTHLSQLTAKVEDLLDEDDVDWETIRIVSTQAVYYTKLRSGDFNCAALQLLQIACEVVTMYVVEYIGSDSTNTENIVLGKLQGALNFMQQQ
jgi:hypothetical protein